MMSRVKLARAFCTSSEAPVALRLVKSYSVRRLEEQYLKDLETKLKADCKERLKNFTFRTKSNTVFEYLQSGEGISKIDEDVQVFEKLLYLSWIERLFGHDGLSITIAQKTLGELKSRKYVFWPVINRVIMGQTLSYLKMRHPGYHDQMEAAWTQSELERITVLGAKHAEIYCCHSALKGIPGVKADLLGTEISRHYPIPLTFQTNRPTGSSKAAEGPARKLLFKSVLRSQLEYTEPIHSAVFSESEEELAQRDFIYNLTRYHNLRLVSEFSQRTGGQTLVVSITTKTVQSDDPDSKPTQNPLSVWRPLAKQLVDLVNH